MPSAPAFETAAASPGTAAIGACTIGCSMPSKSHTGVRIALTPLRDCRGPYFSYDDGIVCGALRSQPWKRE